MKNIPIFTILILLSLSSSAFAYIGPGMGGGVAVGVLGVIGAIFLALFGILYYPIKRLIKKRQKKKET